MAVLDDATVIQAPLRSTGAPWACSRHIRIGDAHKLQQGSGRDDAVGNPLPSYLVPRHGMACHPGFRLTVNEGEREISVDVLQPEASAERPFLRVKANPDIGLTADITTTALAGTGWQTLIAPLTATADGAVRVELWNADPGFPCWFDNLGVQAAS